MADVLLRGCSIILAVTFAWAGLTKILRPGRWLTDLHHYRVGRAVRIVAFGIAPWVEVSAALVVAAWPRAGGMMILALIPLFSAAIVRVRILQGTDQIGCGCFGARSTRDYRVLLLRNGALAAGATLLVTSRSVRRLAIDLSWWVVAVAFIAVAGTAALWAARELAAHKRRAGEPFQSPPVAARGAVSPD